jgi:hypothetical protein
MPHFDKVRNFDSPGLFLISREHQKQFDNQQGTSIIQNCQFHQFREGGVIADLT